MSLPKSTLAKACNYTLTLWNRLTRFLDHPVLELSNNAAENGMRPIALGRKKWIHFGSKGCRPEDRRDLIDRRDLPTIEYPDPRLPQLTGRLREEGRRRGDGEGKLIAS